MTISDITAALTGEGVMAKKTGVRERSSHDDIARRAYQLYERRGRLEGQDLDDWRLPNRS
jgi:hypothetical protein